MDPIIKEQVNAVFNVLSKWKHSLSTFGKLDEWSLNKDMGVLGSLIRMVGDRRLRLAICACRDAAVTGKDVSSLFKEINAALDILPVEKDPNEPNPDFGQTERWMSVTRSLYHERIRFKNGKKLRGIDVNLEKNAASRYKLRRIVEKRMSQAYHRRSKGVDSTPSNRVRHRIGRAVSYQLYNLGQYADPRHFKREVSTHWVRGWDPVTCERVIRQKHGYSTIEEAEAACQAMVKSHPKDLRAVSVYKCEHCGMYHIGHTVLPEGVLQVVSA